MKREKEWTPIITANQETVYPFSNHATSTRTLTTSRLPGQVLINRLDRGERERDRERDRKPKARLRRNNSLELGGALTSWIREERRRHKGGTGGHIEGEVCKCVEWRRGNARWMAVENGERQWAIAASSGDAFAVSRANPPPISSGAGSSLGGPPRTAIGPACRLRCSPPIATFETGEE